MTKHNTQLALGDMDPMVESVFMSTMTSSSSSTFLLAAEESLRQYIPLVVSALVIVDILLGSPAANAVLGSIRPKEQSFLDSGEQAEQDNVSRPFGSSTTPGNTQRERVDTTEVAKAALERARTALEWNTEREKYKTDEQRMEEIRRKMDDQMRDFDSKGLKQ